MCPVGFLAAVADCSCVTKEGDSFTTRIIPDLSFTCSGIVTHWRAAGKIRTVGNARTNSVLSIWREREDSEPGTYDRVMELNWGFVAVKIQLL